MRGYRYVLTCYLFNTMLRGDLLTWLFINPMFVDIYERDILLIWRSRGYLLTWICVIWVIPVSQRKNRGCFHPCQQNRLNNKFKPGGGLTESMQSVALVGNWLVVSGYLLVPMVFYVEHGGLQADLKGMSGGCSPPPVKSKTNFVIAVGTVARFKW